LRGRGAVRARVLCFFFATPLTKKVERTLESMGQSHSSTHNHIAAPPAESKATVTLRSFEQVLKSIRSGGAEEIAMRAQRLLVEISDSCVETVLSVASRQKPRFVTVEYVRQMVELLHETLGVIGVDCYGCQLSDLGKQLMHSDTENMTETEAAEFMRRYSLGVCGFIDEKNAWSIDDRVLARIEEKVDKARAISSLVQASETRGGIPPPAGAAETGAAETGAAETGAAKTGAAADAEAADAEAEAETADGGGDTAMWEDIASTEMPEVPRSVSGYNSEENEVDDVGQVVFVSPTSEQ